MKRLFALLLVMMLSAMTVLAQDSDTLIDVMQTNPDVNQQLTTLVAAIDAAGLTSTLESGEFTIFAPTDGAFRTLLTELDMTTDELLADTALLEDVLTYHVLSGTTTFVDLEELAGQRNDGVVIVQTLNGATLRFAVDANADTAVINGGAASVTIADVTASNGVIHVIDNVLLPPEDAEPAPLGTEEAIAGATEEAITDTLEIDPAENTLAVVIAELPDFSTLTTALDAAELTEALNDPEEPYTVFAPTDQAFRNLLATVDLTEDELLESDLLDDILLYHVAEALEEDEENITDRDGGSLETLQPGGAISIRVDSEGVITLNGFIDVVDEPIIVQNGVIYPIDNVLLPQEALDEFGL